MWHGCRATIHVGLGVLAALLLAQVSALAQDVRTSCPDFFQNLHQSTECLEALFTQTDMPAGLPHLTLSSIAPGNGFPYGIVWEKRKHMVQSPFNDHVDTSGEPVAGNKSLVDLTAALVRSTNGSWYGTASVVWFPPIPYKPDRTTKQNVGVQFYVTHGTYETISFFGLGPTPAADAVTYKQTGTFGGATVRAPLTDWFAVTGQIEIRKPQIVFSGSSVGAEPITESTAPGAQSQPDFLHYSTGVRLRAQAISEPVTNDPAVTPPGQPPPPLMKHKIVLMFANEVTEHWYEDQNRGTYSFRQFAVEGDNSIKLHAVVRRFVPPAAMTAGLRFVKHFCNDRSSGLKVDDECDFGELHLRPLVVLSNAGSGTTPFYLQPTLGGSDIESRLTLLGFDNYRFRAPDAAMVGVDYQMRVIDPIGAFLFYDAGAVGNASGGFAGSVVRQDGGAGATLRIANNVVARVYVGFGDSNARYGYNFTKFF